MAQRGGYRPGAGRKKGIASIEAEKMHAFIAEKLSQNIGPIVAKAIEQAVDGNQAARDWLSDRALGKPKQGIELTGKDGEPFYVDDNQYQQAIGAAAEGSSGD